MCLQSEKLLSEKFPHLLLDDQKFNYEICQVLLTESRLEETQPPMELLMIKEENFGNLEDIKDEIEKDVLSEVSEEDEEDEKEKPEKKKPEKRKRKKSEIKKPRYACHLCGKTYNKWHLEIHLRSHNSNYRLKYDCMLKLNTFCFSLDIRPYKCTVEDCGKSFLSTKDLSTHSHSHSKLNLQCDICQKFYQSTKALRDHKRFRHVEPNIPCTQCDMKFKTK